MWTLEVLYVAAPRKPSWLRWSRLVWRGQQGTTIPPARQVDANRMSVIQKYGILYLTLSTKEIKQDISIAKLNISNLQKAVIPPTAVPRKNSKVAYLYLT